MISFVVKNVEISFTLGLNYFLPSSAASQINYDYGKDNHISVMHYLMVMVILFLFFFRYVRAVIVIVMIIITITFTFQMQLCA